MLFSILTTDNVNWDVLFEGLPIEQQDIFYSRSFAKLCEKTLNHKDEVLCAVMTSDDGVVLYPFVRRNISAMTNFSVASNLYDITGLYGRGGIVASLKNETDLVLFHDEMKSYCNENNIVCAFERYHPIIANEDRISGATEVMDIGGFVAVDLRPEMMEIESSFKQSVRKDLRKSERNGITCFAESNCDHLKEFMDIYYHTMGRNSADDFYYFNEEYFETLCQEIPGKFYFFYAVAEGEVVSCELVLHHGKYCHSFLGGTKREALPLCANPFLKREIIKFFKEHGCDYFLLGGGSKPNDGIFKFKKAYAPDGILPSKIGAMIWNQPAYQQMKEDMLYAGLEVPQNRFQFYDVN
jgi:hypothetical protein